MLPAVATFIPLPADKPMVPFKPLIDPTPEDVVTLNTKVFPEGVIVTFEDPADRPTVPVRPFNLLIP